MPLQIDAIYEHGTLKLSRPLSLPDGQKVTILIQSPSGATKRLAGLIPWAGNREELNRYLSDPDEGALSSHDV